MTPSNFIKDFIVEDLGNKRYGSVHTRFPPEPNGYLHIGHAKSICINFSIARQFNGVCNLRFDDTNPAKEEVEYVDSIKEDVKWLGFDWGENEFYASDYYGLCYEFAEQLIVAGKAYICHLKGDSVGEYRGTLTSPGKASPWRDRPASESLEIFRKMRNGEIEEGEAFLRAKIDMASPNMNMRDPAIYRIKKESHHRTGNEWIIYPMYDYAHPIGDWIEGISHSICTLEFEDHRPLYEWVLNEIKALMNSGYVPSQKMPEALPRQIEFARLNLTYTVMSKRLLRELVENGHVLGWDDPRIPTISGLRRRGYTPSSLREFAERIGVAKTDSTVDIQLLYFCIREELNKDVQRTMVILDPLKIVITNWEEGKEDILETENNPGNLEQGTRQITFGREIYIERDDFMEEPPKKYFRLFPGSEVRLKGAYYITCKEVIKNEKGDITELRCVYDPESRGGETPDARKVRGTLHWVNCKNAVDVEVRLFENLFTLENPMAIPEGKSYMDYVDKNSMLVKQAKAEPLLASVKPYDRFQFVRHGYFCVDSKDSTAEKPVFNRIVGLKDSWGKMQAGDKG
ncbi:MAG: glutamine--tRNA ligase/YqeY domain fusion protein [Fibromonadaceae bacterium]|jgi:glutaminyl-tRNA synthetase|nr:glutamine--tRNA ligase/YqeY domain fusion protein [Fibromonadaceae bacterium]